MPSLDARPRAPSLFRPALRVAWGLGVCAFLWFAWTGRSYYLTPLAERAHHEDYWRLKPGGSLGIAFGMAGLAMMTAMHAYSARKRIRALRRAGPLARWLDLHILLGVLGPLCVVLHSSLKVGGLVAISFWSMVAVAASGVMGRYLYLQIPRTRAGDVLSREEAVQALRTLSKTVGDAYGVDPTLLASIAPAREGLLATLGRVLWDDLTGASRRRLRAHVAKLRLPESTARSLRDLLQQKAALDRRVAFWDELHGLFHYWHVAHKPFAVVMYLFVVVHVAVAAATGYAWGG
jgi:hypothetical protein